MTEKTWFSKISGRQKAWLSGASAAVLLLVCTGLYVDSHVMPQSMGSLNIQMSINEIAPKTGMTGKGLARELDLPLSVPKDRSLESLGRGQAELDHAVEHVLSHRERYLKYFIFAAVVLWGLVFLVTAGRPDGSSVKDRGKWYPRTPYIICLLVSVSVSGFLLGKSPNPMEGAVKLFKTMAGLYPDPLFKAAAFVFFILLAVTGNKMICGWACPFGALQELVYSIPVLKGIKRQKISFVLTNTIRLSLFILMSVFLFGIAGGKKGFVIYHNMNPFNLFEPDFESTGVILTVILALAGSFFVYRPFCMFICPFGLISWIAERFSIFRVKIDREKCTGCGACIAACPVQAAEGMVEDSFFQADCFSCGRCLNVCPHDALHYKSAFRLKTLNDSKVFNKKPGQE